MEENEIMRNVLKKIVCLISVILMTNLISIVSFNAEEYRDPMYHVGFSVPEDMEIINYSDVDGVALWTFQNTDGTTLQVYVWDEYEYLPEEEKEKYRDRNYMNNASIDEAFLQRSVIPFGFVLEEIEETRVEDRNFFWTCKGKYYYNAEYDNGELKLGQEYVSGVIDFTIRNGYLIRFFVAGDIDESIRYNILRSLDNKSVHTGIMTSDEYMLSSGKGGETGIKAGKVVGDN